MVGADCDLADANDLPWLLLDKAIVASVHLQDVEAVGLIFAVPTDVDRRRLGIRTHDGSAIVDAADLEAKAVVDEEH